MIKRAQLIEEIVELLVIWEKVLLYWLDYLQTQLVAEPEVTLLCSQDDSFVELIDDNAKTLFGKLQLPNRFM